MKQILYVWISFFNTYFYIHCTHLQNLSFSNCINPHSLLSFTWNHTMQTLDMILGHSALRAHFVYEASNEPHHRVGSVAGFRVFKPTLSVKAFCHTSCNTVHNKTPITHCTIKTFLK